jgi:hypothetical protein
MVVSHGSAAVTAEISAPSASDLLRASARHNPAGRAPLTALCSLQGWRWLAPSRGAWSEIRREIAHLIKARGPPAPLFLFSNAQQVSNPVSLYKQNTLTAHTRRHAPCSLSLSCYKHSCPCIHQTTTQVALCLAVKNTHNNNTNNNNKHNNFVASLVRRFLCNSINVTINTSSPAITNTMRSFQTIIFFLAALVAFAFAQDTQSYDATVYVTSTIYKVNTVTLSSSPAYEVSNSTTTIAPSAPTGGASYSVPANSTAPYPTNSGATSGTPPAPSTTDFGGAASGLSVNGAMIAMVAAALGFLAL